MKYTTPKKYCIYPISDPLKNHGQNSYIDDLINAIEKKNNTVVNKNEYTKLGVVSLFKFIFKADIFIFNWLEGVPFKRFGNLQSVCLPFLFVLLKFLNKKNVYILHNKYSHAGNTFFSRFNVFISVFFSSKIITHSSEGLEFIKLKFPYLLNKSKINFVNHPVYSVNILTDSNTKDSYYDYLIWGSISPYKGVYEFLTYINKNKRFEGKKILLCGKASSLQFYNKLKGLNLLNVEIINNYVNEEKLQTYIENSKAILFVYNSESVLSSGALIKSLNYGKPIIGPFKGSFKDLYKQGLISCFSSYDEIFLNESFYDLEKNKNFLAENTWDKLIDNFL
jgi:beta-1,4-mannosyltransferase